MIINLCGFGWSGSGAFLDLLREYEEVTLPTDKHWEFNLLWVPDGLYDLEYKLCNKHCRIFDSALAIDRFLAIAKQYGGVYFRYDKVLKESFYKLCRDYINELVQFRLEGNTVIHKLHPSVKDVIVIWYNHLLSRLFRNRIISRLKGKYLYYHLYCNNYKKMLVSYNPDIFLSVTQDFVEKIIDKVRVDRSKMLVLDQSFSPDMPHLFDHFLKETHKTIIVRRDPRDTYILIKQLKGISRPVPTNIDDFIMFYKKTIAETIMPDTEMLMSIQYEDLIYNYDATVDIIEDFLKIKKHREKLKIFNPKVSINNTQLINLYPEYKDDISKIEKELSDYLYPFDNYNFTRNTNEIF